MSGLLSSLQTSGNALRDFEKCIGVVQDNVVNASTPGYVRQQLTLASLPYDPASGWFGGVRTTGLANARNEYAEQAVRREVQDLGYAATKSTALSGVESAFDVTGTSSLSKAISSLFSAFSSWSVSPQDGTQRQGVLTAAGQLASAFRQTAADLTKNGEQMVAQAQSEVASINNLAAQIAALNQSSLHNAQGAAANGAEMHAALEELSGLVNYTTLTAGDGTVSVLLGGQIPLVMGDKSYALALETEASPSGNALPAARVVDVNGQNVSPLVTGGNLGGLLSAYNEDLGSILGTATERGSLNDLAYGLANRVNEIFLSGQVDDPEPPATATPGRELFIVANDSSAAATLTLDATVGVDDLAAIDLVPEKSANGIPTRLAALADPTQAGDKIGGLSFTGFYGSIASGVGVKVNAAKSAENRQTQLVSQARSMRSDISGVSLDEEAASLLQFQRSYEATSRVVTVINDLMDSLINLVRQ
jgi:flagellar hook-associated protein 1 FlgK